MTDRIFLKKNIAFGLCCFLFTQMAFTQETDLLPTPFEKNENHTATYDEAIDFYQQVLDLDPTYGQAYSGLVESYLLQGFGVLNSQEAYAQFRIYLQKAIELDEEFANDHHQLAMIKVFSEWEWAGAAEELRLAINKNPEAWEPYDSYCQLMWAMGRIEESIEAGRKAVEKDPEPHFAKCDFAWAYFFDGQLDNA